MNAQCIPSSGAVLAPSGEEIDHHIRHVAYQVATVGAIVLFLLSFWSW